ncbi:MAG TPA: DUF411 domain-containing protein [Gemmatimonadaceae bacterium]|nr:DUF411 domain-containing protein [Gemmatimonadaceae bacterium]
MSLPTRAIVGAGAVIVLAAVALGLGLDTDDRAPAPDALAAEVEPLPAASLAAGLAEPDSVAARSHPERPEMIVYKSPTCGCCGLWEDRMRDAGYQITSRDTSDVGAVKRRLGLPHALESCHTAIVDGYVVEGHVPASAVSRLLRERPAVVGIAVPGMPMGSPGMDTGPRKDPFDVVTFDRAGRTTVYSSH